MKNSTFRLLLIALAMVASSFIFSQGTACTQIPCKAFTNYNDQMIWGQLKLLTDVVSSTFTISPTSVWTTTGNTVASNIFKLGSLDNRSFKVITNSIDRFKFDSVGIFRLYPTTATTSIGGSINYDDVTNGFCFVAPNGINALTIKSTSGLIRGGVNTYTSGTYLDGVIIGSWSNDNVYIGTNLDAALQGLKISKTNGYVTINPTIGTNTTSILRVSQGGAANIFEVTPNTETNPYFKVAATTGNASFSNTVTSFTGNISLASAGNRISIKTGTGASLGTTTLTAGTVSVANTNITANSKIFITARGVTNAGFLGTTLAASTGFTITSSSGTDARVIDYLIIEGQ